MHQHYPDALYRRGPESEIETSGHAAGALQLATPRLRRGRDAAAEVLAHTIVRHLGFVPSPHNMRAAIDKSNIAGDVACAVADQKGRHRADIGDERRFVER